MTDRYDGTASVPARIGVRSIRRPDRAMHSVMAVNDAICHHGRIRMAAHAMNADMLGGWAADRHCDGDWVFTTDMSIRVPLIDRPETIDGNAELLRAGRTVVSSSCEFSVNGTPIGYADVTYMRLSRRHGDPRKVVIDDIEFPILPPLDLELPHAAGLEVVDASAGHVRCELNDTLRNPAGAMQGAISALAVEYGAEVMVERHFEAPHLATDLDIRYLAMGRVGPMRTEAAFIGDPTARTTRVRLFDDGNEGRLCYTALLRFVPIG